MGVRGLTTYIANNHRKYLKKYKLHNCYVIIDGNSLACQLFVKFTSKARCAFGGDYDKYVQYVRDFFLLLSKCDVKAIVLFDGGYEPRKINTVISRMSDRIAALSHVTPGSQNSAIIFPLLMRVVFKQILKEMNIPFVQCDFEADQEIASLAYKYNCPVLSYDSDFYIFDVSYIPIPTLEFEATPLNFELGQTSEKYYINCKIYKIDYFLNSFGGLDKSMLPLLASLLGNDYIKITVFKKFYSQLKIPKGKGNPLQRKIARVIEWLRNETFESAVKKILGRMKRMKHRSVTHKIIEVVNAYTDFNVTIEPYLPIEFTKRGVVEQQDKIPRIDCLALNDESTPISEEMDVEMNQDNSKESSSETENEEETFSEFQNDDACVGNEMDVEMAEITSSINEVADNRSLKIPPWLIESVRKGNIESCIFDILTLRTYFAVPQVEERFHKSSHLASISLIKLISKFLLGNSFKDISLFTKNENGRVQRFLLHLSETPLIADLNSVPKLSVASRSLLLLECLNVPSEFSADFLPDEWKLYFCAIVFWLKNSGQPLITESHVFSLCLCIVALNLIDSKLGYFRKKIPFYKKYGKLQKKIIKARGYAIVERYCDKDDSVDDSISLTEVHSNTEEIPKEFPSAVTIKQISSSISTEDCIAVFEDLFRFHLLDEELKDDKNLFSTKDIHIFAQFQSCLYHAMLLNSLLDLPFQQPVVSRLYSGTFVYNTCMTLNNCKNVTNFIDSLLKHSSNILTLVKEMLSVLTRVAPVEVVKPPIKKSRHRKRKRTLKVIERNELEMSDKNVEETPEDSFYDKNNAFSLLTSM
ncbi:single-strand DNA endonuclease protein asteroid [Lycorma delicatula]|uniref:single-strand DNA endonuclease protein asteroid n=1 Tax=Lycorma delicatula TaxID=130591 RepID=UPI003F5163D0